MELGLDFGLLISGETRSFVLLVWCPRLIGKVIALLQVCFLHHGISVEGGQSFPKPHRVQRCGLLCSNVLSATVSFKKKLSATVGHSYLKWS